MSPKERTVSDFLFLHPMGSWLPFEYPRKRVFCNCSKLPMSRTFFVLKFLLVSTATPWATPGVSFLPLQTALLSRPSFVSRTTKVRQLGLLEQGEPLPPTASPGTTSGVKYHHQEGWRKERVHVTFFPDFNPAGEKLV